MVPEDYDSSVLTIRISMYLILLYSLLLSGSWQGREIKPHTITGFAQGTSYQVTYYAKEKTVSKSEIEGIFSEIDSSLSIYKPYSLISRFNRSKQGLTMDRHLEHVVKKAFRVSQSTGGVFDITVLPLVQAWGFGTESVAFPDSAGIRALLPCVGMDKLRIQGNFLRKELPCVQIDVNGIAQGYTVDVLAAFLEMKGLKNYLVELGGEIRVRGRKLDGKHMSIGIEGPVTAGGHYPVQHIISIPSGAVTTSGNYRKYRQYGQKKITHLVNAETGYPLENRMISVTVVAGDAITADGYDNALMGMGLDKALQFAYEKKDIEAYFIYRKENGVVADTATTEFYRLMEKY